MQQALSCFAIHYAKVIKPFYRQVVCIQREHAMNPFAAIMLEFRFKASLMSLNCAMLIALLALNCIDYENHYPYA